MLAILYVIGRKRRRVVVAIDCRFATRFAVDDEVVCDVHRAQLAIAIITSIRTR